MGELSKLDFKNYLRVEDSQLRNIDHRIASYKRFSEDPENCDPMILMFVPAEQEYTIGETLHDPRKMLKNALDRIQTHFDVGDDFVPALRVEFGTGQVAHAYGCEIYEQENDMPCAKTHILKSADDVVDLEEPGPDAGHMVELEEYYRFFREYAPSLLRMQIPDFQGPFNNAHLVRGNDILTDFYDEPELVELLLEKMSRYQAKLTQHFHEMFSADDDNGWFCDWGAYWRGGVRVSNCSLHMISPDFYNRYVKKWDRFLIESQGAGRMHYCGTHDNGLFDSFFSLDSSFGIDFDGAYHDVWELSPRTPKQVTLLQYMKEDQINRLLSGDWPDKRNLILQVSATSVEEGRALLTRLRASMPKRNGHIF